MRFRTLFILLKTRIALHIKKINKGTKTNNNNNIIIFCLIDTYLHPMSFLFHKNVFLYSWKPLVKLPKSSVKQIVPVYQFSKYN